MRLISLGPLLVPEQDQVSPQLVNIVSEGFAPHRLLNELKGVFKFEVERVSQLVNFVQRWFFRQGQSQLCELLL